MEILNYMTDWTFFFLMTFFLMSLSLETSENLLHFILKKSESFISVVLKDLIYTVANHSIKY